MDLSILGPLAPFASAGVAVIAAVFAARRENKRLRSEVERNSASAMSELAGAYAETTEALRSELRSMREELNEARAERQDLTDELAAIRTAVEQALALLRALPGAEPAVAILEQPKPRRRRRAAPTAEAA